MIYLPPNYDPSGDPIAVMYLLDGKGHFLHTAGIVDFLIAQRRIPEMMVVAIPNTKDRTRDLTPVIELDSSAKTGFPSAGGADQMLSFIKDELIPKIDSDYNANKYRLLVGHSFGGIFSVNALMKEPDLFDAHISISPRRLLKYPTCADICKITFSVKRIQPFSSFLTLLILSQLRPGIFLRLAASESDDLRLQHQTEYFNSLLVCGGIDRTY